jgi:hypothetical protein
MKRIVYRVTYRPKGYLNSGQARWRIAWHGLAGAPCHLWADTQTAAVKQAVGGARNHWRDGRHAQVVLHGRNGRIRWERTYGRDPRRSKG